MKPSPTPPLLALLANPQRRAKIRFALRFGTATRVIGPTIHARNWHELGVLAASNPGSPALVDYFVHPDHLSASPGTGEPGNGALSRTPVICYANLEAGQRWELKRTGVTIAAHLRPGVDDDDPLEIEAAILKSIDERHVRRLLLRIDEAASPDVAEIMGYAFDLAVRPHPVSALARHAGRRVRTLQRHCAKLGIPSPKSLLSLARIFTVQRLAEWSRQPRSAVAMVLGFSHRSNYRRLVRSTFGRNPTELGQLGGRNYMAESILERVADSGCRDGA